LRGDVAAGNSKSAAEANHQVSRVQLFAPVSQEAARFIKGLLRRRIRIDFIAH